MTNIKRILTFENVEKVYVKGGNEINALKNLSFSIKPNTLTLINGPSGAGKTTLIYLAGLIKKPTRGEIRINGIKTRDLNENERSKLIRENIGLMYRRSNLLPNLNVLENVMLPMISQDKGKTEKLLGKVGITGWDRFPCDLTFEEEQKVALVRAIINDPVLVLADEPTGELGSEETHNFIKLLQQMDGTAIIITSDYNFPQESFDERFELKNGILNVETLK